MALRFKTVSIEEVMKLKEAAENLNTRKSTINCVRVFEKWCDENSLEENLEMILPGQLDKVLKRFYASLCKQDGTDYEPGSLELMQAALDHRLKEKGSFSIIKEREFFSSRKVLEGKARKLRNERKGKLPNVSRSLPNQRGRRSFVGKWAAWKCISTVTPEYNVVAALTEFWPTWLPRALPN